MNAITDKIWGLCSTIFWNHGKISAGLLNMNDRDYDQESDLYSAEPSERETSISEVENSFDKL